MDHLHHAQYDVEFGRVELSNVKRIDLPVQRSGIS
jgi:hypothetical protein